MSVRTKTLIVIGLTFLALLGILYFAARWFLLRDANASDNSTTRDITRFLATLDGQFAVLDATVADWAQWDDTYNFINSGDTAYIDSNLPDSEFADLGVELMLFIDNSGKVVYGKMVDLDSGVEIPIPKSLSSELQVGSRLLNHKDPTDKLTGILSLPEGPMIISSQAIVTSAGEGPIRGTLIMGRRLNQKQIGKLSQTTLLSVSAFPYNDGVLPNDVALARNSLVGERSIFVADLSETIDSGYTLINDVYGNPALILRVDTPRAAFMQANTSVRYLGWALLSIGLVLCLVTMFLLERMVIVRLTSLNSSVMKIGNQGTASSRVKADGNDEIFALATSVNSMLDSLEESRDKERASDQRYANLASISPVGIFRTDPNGATTYVNPMYCQISGLSVDEALGAGWLSAVHPEDKEGLTKGWQEATRLHKASFADYRLMRPDGTVAWVMGQAIPEMNSDNQVVGYVGTITNITELKRAEDMLVKERDLLTTLIDTLPDNIFIKDVMGRIVINNIAHQRTLGANNLEQVVGKTDFDFFPRELAAQYDADEKEVVRSGESLIDKEEPFIDKDHNQRWLLTTKVPLRDRQGTITGIVGFNHDITGRKQADEKLAEERNLLRTLIDNLPDRIMAMDSQGRKTLTNLADMRSSGRNKMEDVIGKTDLDIYPPDLAAEFWAIDKAVLDTGVPNINHEEAGVDAEGNPVWVLSTKVPLRDGQGNIVGLVGIGRDITVRKQTEAQVQRQVETLGMLYNLSRGLAEMEDFNAILDLLTRQAVEATHVTFSCILLVENGDLVARAAFPIRALDHDLQVGQREPLASHPFCKRILEEYTPRVLQSDSPEAGDCAPFFLGIAQTLCFVPLHTRERPLGLMILGEVRNAVREPFTEEKVHLARSIGDQAASSLHRALLFEATVRQLDQLRSLHDIDRAIGGSVDLRMMLNVILEQAAAQLQVDAAAVLLLNPHTQILEYAAGRGFRSQAYERTRVRLGEGQAGRAALERRIIQLPDITISGAVFAMAKLLTAENVAAYFVVPLVAKGEVKGVLEIFHRSPLKPDLGWIDFLETLAGQAAIAIDGAQLFDRLQRANIDLTIAYDRTIEGWSHALDLRDKETEGHTLRVTELVGRLARSAGVAEADLIHIRRGALLHDIGKMGVRDDVLLKPDKLTDDEWVLMRRHPQFAFDMLAPIAHLKPALDIPYCHHEKWDGTGYPRGLKGEQIPLAARLFAVVDVWDALLSDRPYRLAWPKEKVLEYIKAGSGTHFDPKAVQLFLKMIREEAREHGQGAG